MLGRIEIVVKPDKDFILDYNYYYSMQKPLIFDSIALIDEEKSIKLHNEGYRAEDNKIHKLVTYQLYVENIKKHDDKGIYISHNDTVKIVLSGKKNIINLIIKGLMKQGYIKYYDNKLNIVNFSNDKNIKFNDVMLYKVRTPMVAVINNELGKREYLNPVNPRFFELIGKNLLRKYKLIYGKDYEGGLYFDIEDLFNIKQRFIKNIKNGFLIGYSNFELFIEADRDMQKVAYYCGVGSNNSVGMGVLSYITSMKGDK